MHSVYMRFSERVVALVWLDLAWLGLVRESIMSAIHAAAFQKGEVQIRSEALSRA